MANYRVMEEEFSKILGLERRPVAIAFSESPPAGVPKFAGTAPSGCSFWRIAAEGRTFYTVPGDHYNCPIGSYTHNLPLPQERTHELSETLSLMAGIGYLKMEEVPGIPRLPRSPGVVTYAPLGDTPAEPDVVLFRGPPGRLMLLQEAALRAGVDTQVPHAGVIASTGCVGNRVYTDAGEDELYVAVRGKDLPRIADAAETVAAANIKLSEYHQERRQALATE